MRLGVIGVNDKVANLKTREHLAKLCQRCLTKAVEQTACTALLCTCNRTEVYFSSDDVARTHAALLELFRQDIGWEFEQQLYSFFGSDCLQHLARVASGIDSAIIAETEIQGQVKLAYEAAAAKGPFSSELHFAFQKALKIGKLVRRTLPWQQKAPGLEHAICATAQVTISDIKHARLLVVGASQVNKKVLKFLQKQGLTNITLCNRSEKSAQALANGLDIQILAWQDLNCWRSYDWIVCGTKAPDYLLTFQEAKKGVGRCRLLIDLSVPRNIDPEIAHCEEVRLCNIDELHELLQIRRLPHTHLIKHAEAIVDQEASKQVRLFKERRMRRSQLLAISA